MKRVLLVCGDRDWENRKFLERTLDRLQKKYKFTRVIQGGARGADKMAKKWAKKRGLKGRTFEADWGRFRYAAGPIRNRQMLKEGKPDFVAGFHNNIAKSKGTKDMLTISKKAGIKTKLYQEDL